jgi:hypothetical protein
MNNDDDRVTNKQVIVRRKQKMNGDVIIEILNTITRERMEVKYFLKPKSVYETKDFANNLSIHLGCEVQYFEEQVTWIRTE